MTIIIDTAEKTPFQFGNGVKTESAHMATGDYSIKGLERFVSIERKSLSDLIRCVSTDRERFVRELHRLQAYRCRAVVISAPICDVYNKNYRSLTTRQSILGSICSWQVRYNIPFFWAGNHEQGADITYRLLKAFTVDFDKNMKAATTAILGLPKGQPDTLPQP